MKFSCAPLKIMFIFLSLPFYFACQKNVPITKPESIIPNEILVSPFPNLGPEHNFSTGTLLKLNYSGDIIQQKNFNTAVFNFRRWQIDGKISYSYAIYETLPITPISTWLACSIILTDENLSTKKVIRLLDHPGHDNRLDGHEFILLDDNSYIVETYYSKKVTNIPDSVPHSSDCTIMAPLIQEVKNGKVVFEWDGSEFPEFYAASIEGNDFTNTATPQDYMHMNSVKIDPSDENLVVSFRHTDQFIKIDRKTGAILWRLGGKKSDFQNSNQLFLRQHDVKPIGNHTYLFIDNGDFLIRRYSRILEIEIDEVNKTVKNIKSTSLPKGFPYIGHMGSVEKIGDTYFVGGGTIPMNFEIDANTGELISKQPLPTNSYRAYKY